MEDLFGVILSVPRITPVRPSLAPAIIKSLILKQRLSAKIVDINIDFYNTFAKKYWTDYNTVEFASWAAKAFIIVPGLIFGIQIWWLYFFTLATSLTLIWASEKKLLPTLVGFNTIWVWISCMVLAKHLIP
jgi:hypothetical protein